MWKRVFTVVALVGGLIGCVEEGDTDTDTQPDDTRTAGIALTTDILADTDVEGMKFTVTRTLCPGDSSIEPATHKAVKDLEDIMFPGDISTFENEPYDSDSEHLFADHFFLLPAGCYDVAVQPLGANQEPSDDCYPAFMADVQVNDGQTTEVMLISQCEGPPRGGLDVIATINHPPQIDAVTFNPSKFTSCPDGTEVCVRVSDPDSDPLSISWSQTAGPGTVAPAVSSTTQNADGSITQCAQVIPPQEGAYQFDVEVYDLAFDADGNIIRIEDLLALMDNPHDSHDDLLFPVYADDTCGDGVVSPEPPPQPPTDPPTEPDDGCTLTQGYWKTHNESASAPGLQIDWPAPEDESTMMCGKTWLSILHTPPAGGSAWFILAHQWIAAKLNVASGATTDGIASALADAESLLVNNCTTIPSSDRNLSLTLAALLDSYNNGNETAPHCDDVDDDDDDDDDD